MKRKRLGFFDILVTMLALVLLLALVLGGLAGFVDPRNSKYIPFFGLAYPYILLLNVFVASWWIIRKRWVMLFITMLIIGLGWNALTATFRFTGDAGKGPKADSSYIRMMTYNVHGFRPFDEGNTDSVKSQMLHLIEGENPDIITMQEYYSRRKGSYDLTDSLKGILKTPYFYFYPSSENEYEATGLAIFSKFPIKNKGTIEFDGNKSGNASIYVDVLVQNSLLRIYNVHLQSIAFGPEDYQYINKVKKDMDPELRPSKRILSMLKMAFVKRSQQVDIMKAHMETCKTAYLIAGDFNDTPASYAVTQLTDNMNKSFNEQGKGLGRTYNGKFPNFQIDYIATTKNIQIINHLVTNARLSDHFPVRADLKINP
jgi:endonuclease/exonuclease/phosphatase family metal-dependent hydrolase